MTAMTLINEKGLRAKGYEIRTKNYSKRGVLRLAEKQAFWPVGGDEEEEATGHRVLNCLP